MNNLNSPLQLALQRLGQRLRRARLDANLTQADLAAAAGVSQKTVANAEDGHNVSTETLAALLAGMGRLDELERLLPDEGPSPVELARRRGRRRQRATGRRGSTTGENSDWSW